MTRPTNQELVSVAVDSYVRRYLDEQNDEIERLLAEAIRLHEPNHGVWWRLHVVYQDGCSPAVASFLNGTGVKRW